MTDKTVIPILAAKSFTCPYVVCGALSHQVWFSAFVDPYDKENEPWMPTASVIEELRNAPRSQEKDELIKFAERKLSKELFLETIENTVYLRSRLENLNISRCYSCRKFALWVADDLIYPATTSIILPDEEMPANILADFNEAAEIVDKSPRGAAALLRLSIQKLMPHLGLKGKNLDDDIGALVKRGLDGRIQKALDVVRVVGNNAVHPGQIDLEDDKATAIKLFGLVNLIVEAMIATPKHVEKMYGELPKAALEAIKKRDKNEGD